MTAKRALAAARWRYVRVMPREQSPHWSCEWRTPHELDRARGSAVICGYPPGSDWPECPDHVCGRWGVGAIVRAPTRSAPHPGDPFVIVDDRPVVRTISRSAEALLMLADRGTDSGTHLDSLLVADDREARFDLVQLIELAAAGTPPTGDIALSTVRPPEIRVRGRLTSCLRPAAAVLARAPARYPLPGSSENPPAASHARRGA
jgi:hypothetical protein